ncbi:GTP-binding protein HSR1-related protein [Beutenbergia cavernae DSM 12333]|uniref:GTP-binding protein HSR1-related protein n=1 Tax=Beutenbergia cavernae (strain ATCC BAA-8 / DSM 12333 / CCUG 43141 / JCM 11478 / NBRC 16432 / NCIMB 13614 / HKI 0122) TaxID=471853 RepID=C5BXK2_BEUC1|nr:GTPase [Beutenbergia cavernae]ACQ80885.1 GTP-binding protein HSR1-related protein [Beutenbergia cavernae DSM 12333]
MSVALAERVAALSEAADAGAGRLPADLVDDARAVARRALERGGLSAEHTVVALAGATGSGKSSVLNALVGTELAAVGVQRPTTSHALAAVWGGGADPLLDWLEVRRRHTVDGALAAGPLSEATGRWRRRRSASAPGGLVLLDLPDHDSVVTDHRLRAERLVERADLLVWVVDPQKYADAVLHERYLQPLAGHGAVVVVVLNQIDRLSAQEQAACLADLRRLVAQDGLDGARVLGVSARTGAGLDDLRRLLTEAATRREAATARLVADVRSVAGRIREECGAAPPPGVLAPSDSAQTSALADAAGVGTVVDAVRRSAVRDARAATGWPVTRWVGRFRPDPLRRLGLRRDAAATSGGGDRPDLRRTSLPAPSPASRASSSSAIRAYVRDATTGVPEAWARSARERVQGGEPLADALDVAVAGTDLEVGRRPRWWRAVGVAQWVVLAAGIAGLLWLGVLAGLAYLRLPEPPTPTWEGWPWPTLAVLGAVVLGILLALAARAGAAIGGRRRAERVRRRLHRAVDAVAESRVRGPVREELAALEECRGAALRAAG